MKDISKQIISDIDFLKKEVSLISAKVDQALEILASFVVEPETDEDADTDSNEGWVSSERWFDEEENEDEDEED